MANPEAEPVPGSHEAPSRPPGRPQVLGCQGPSCCPDWDPSPSSLLRWPPRRQSLSRVGPTSNDRCPPETWRGHRARRPRGHLGEIRAMRPRARKQQGCRQPPEAGRDKEGPSPRAQGASPADTLILNLEPPACETVAVLLGAAQAERLTPPLTATRPGCPRGVPCWKAVLAGWPSGGWVQAAKPSSPGSTGKTRKNLASFIPLRLGEPCKQGSSYY